MLNISLLLPILKIKYPHLTEEQILSILNDLNNKTKLCEGI